MTIIEMEKVDMSKNPTIKDIIVRANIYSVKVVMANEKDKIRRLKECRERF